ncbi:hypothetical protein, partial [Leptospira interrogans]|uniref:hypothetical protein n=1 Tax=Leptospira interrogans TaxID=173 RepID=UPI001D15099F
GHFLLPCMKVKSEGEGAEACPALSGPVDCSPPGSSVHGIFQARVLEWGAIAFSVPLLQEVGKISLLLTAVTIPVILEPKKIKSATVSTFPQSVCHEMMGPDAMILGF